MIECVSCGHEFKDTKDNKCPNCGMAYVVRPCCICGKSVGIDANSTVARKGGDTACAKHFYKMMGYEE